MDDTFTTSNRSPVAVVVGRWDSEGRPDDDTAALLAFAEPLGFELRGADLGDHGAEPGSAEAVAALTRRLDAHLVLASSSLVAEDLVPRVAALVEGFAALDCTSLEPTGVFGGLRLRRPAFGGAFDAELEVPARRIVVASVQVPATEIGEPPTVVVEDLAPQAPPWGPSLVRRCDDHREIPLNRARRIVAGGRGIGGPEGFAELAALAEALGASLAASRPPCDAGWVAGRHQVGITGARVAPELYIAIGISGSVQHRAGMQSSRTVVAINSDPDAPMFQHADLAVVGDWRDVVGGMLEVLAQPLQSVGAER